MSPYLTRALLPTRVTPNAVTWAMLAVGLLAAVALSFPGVWTAVLAFVLIQMQILFDCTDGEIARWRKQFSPVGIYLDRLAHYTTETAIPIGLGIRADGGWDSIGDYTTLGLLAAVLALLVRMESALIHVTRLEAGLPKLVDSAEVAAPRPGLLRRARRLLAVMPFFRAFIAVEASALALIAALVDASAGDYAGTRVLVIALVPIAALTVGLRLVAILTSSKLR
jgi:phosphatidylglycerophosphate synthase